MSDTLYFAIAVFVFVMMAIGLALTILEFRFGQPRREDEQAGEPVDSPERNRVREAA